jgi:hypothetical protein
MTDTLKPDTRALVEELFGEWQSNPQTWSSDPIFDKNFDIIPDSELYLYADYVTREMKKRGTPEQWEDFAEDAHNQLLTADDYEQANETAWCNACFVYKHSDLKPTPRFLLELKKYRNRRWWAKTNRFVTEFTQGFVNSGILILAGWKLGELCVKLISKKQ